jgi:hypothetical protein
MHRNEKWREQELAKLVEELDGQQFSIAVLPRMAAKRVQASKTYRKLVKREYLRLCDAARASIREELELKSIE